MILDARINKRSLDLMPGFSIGLEIENPALDTEVVKGAKSYPLAFPVTPPNQVTFGFPELLQTGTDLQKTYPIEIYADGLLYLKGHFKMNRVTKKFYYGYIVGQAGGFKQTIQDTKLNKMDLGWIYPGTVPVTTDLHFVNVPERQDETIYKENIEGEATTFSVRWYTAADQYVVQNASFSGDLAESLKTLAGQITADASIPAKAISSGSTISIFPNVPPVAFPPLFRTSTIFRNDQNILDIAEYEETFSQLVYDSIAPFPDETTANVPGSLVAAASVVFPMIYNPGFYPTENSTWKKYVNYYENGHYLHNTAKDRTKYSLTPMPFLRYVLDKIFAFTDNQASGPVLDDVDLQKLIFYSTVALDDQPADYKDQPFIIGKSEINLSDHLPDVTAAEFLNEYRKLLNFGYFFDLKSNQVELVFLKDILLAPTKKDWTDKAIPDWSKEQQDQTGFTLSFTLDGSDDLTKENPDTKQLHDQYKPFKYGNGEKPLDCKLTSLITAPVDQYILPHADQKAKSKFYELSDTTFGPRLLFWKGLQMDTDGKLFPSASNESDNYKLTWNGPKGLYEKFHKDWNLFLEKSKKTEMEFDLNIFELATIDMKEKIFVAGQKYLIGKISVTLPLTKPVKMVLYQV